MEGTSSSVVGDTFANYRILGVCGRGGMGVVYRAEQLRPRRTVALKVIAPDLAANNDFRQRFESESDIAASIEHPNVIPVYEVGEEGGRLFLVTRYIDGTDLRQVIKDGMSPVRAAHVVQQIGDALDAAHKRGLVHRDVKPANILMAGDHPYLTDFGLTKQTQGDGGGPTKTGTWVGSIDYVAPEQIKGESVDARTDVYALGGVLFHALVGRVPFERESEVSKLWAHMSDPPPTLADARPGIAPALQEVIDRAMAKDPADRYASAGDLGRAAVAAAQGGAIAVPERSVAAGNAAPDTVAAPLVGDAATRAGARPTTQAGEVEDAHTQMAGTAGATAVGTAGTEAGGTAATAAPPAKQRSRVLPFVLGGVGLIVVAAIAAIALSGGGSGDGGGGELTAGTLTGAPIPIPRQPTSIAADANGVWVASRANNSITKIDPRTGKAAGKPIRVGRSPYGVAVGGGSVWTANAGDSTVSRVDPSAGKVVGKPIKVGKLPADLTFGLGSVWVANFKDDTVTRIDAKTGKVVATISVGDGPTDVAAGEGAVWVSNANDDTVSRVNPTTNKPAGAAVPANEQPESITVGAGKVWVGNIRTDVVTRVNPSSGQVEGTPIQVGERPDDVLVYGDGVYVVNQDGDSLVKIDAKSGKVSPPLQVGNAPIAIASSGDRVWIANLEAETVVQVKP